ncbi:copper resistance protein [Actinomycetospora sp. NBRC 106375]|uniref:copper resistance CopC family protein n=1 Tax=Actinomycetospora sp. NBRC 106375 TaxID=3032207 RepID=UPI0024A1701A|nr:copper resistance CopC family protein [Actinomycetospora sp. NBRC 106375]GLZ46126.1 copper resistance protein [Actinomycetospora sp. NBRC 106375]
MLAVLLTGLLAVGALLLSAGPASAHDVLTGSDPADGATVASAPTQVSLTFDEAPKPEGAAVTIVGPDGAHHEQGTPTLQGNVLTAPVGALPQAGRYEIGYRVVSDDGHPVSGSVAFSLTTPSPAAGTAAGTTGGNAGPQAQPAQPSAATPSPAAAAGQDTSGGGVPAWVFVVIAIVVVGGAIALVLRRRA